MRYDHLIKAALIANVSTAFIVVPVGAAPLTDAVISPVSRVTGAISDVVNPLTPPIGSSRTQTPSTTRTPVTNRQNDVTDDLPVVNSVLPSTVQAQSQPVRTSTPPSEPVSQAATDSSQADMAVSSAPEQRNSGSVVRSVRDTSAQSAATANDQVMATDTATTYSSGRISPELARTLYQMAAAVSIGGFLIYAITSLPLASLRVPLKLFKFRTTH